MSYKRKINQADWLQNYQRNLARHKRQREIAKGNDVPPVLCPVCEGELNHSPDAHNLIPDNSQKYQLSESFREINRAIAYGAKFIPLYIIYSGKQAIKSYYNALLLPDWSRVLDANRTTVRWSASRQKFIRTLWILAVIVIAVTF